MGGSTTSRSSASGGATGSGVTGGGATSGGATSGATASAATWCAHARVPSMGPLPVAGLWLRLELPRATAGRAQVSRACRRYTASAVSARRCLAAAAHARRLGPSGCACACADRRARCSRCCRAAGTARRPCLDGHTRWAGWATPATGGRAASVRAYILFIHVFLVGYAMPSVITNIGCVRDAHTCRDGDLNADRIHFTAAWALRRDRM